MELLCCLEQQHCARNASTQNGAQYPCIWVVAKRGLVALQPPRSGGKFSLSFPKGRGARGGKRCKDQDSSKIYGRSRIVLSMCGAMMRR